MSRHLFAKRRRGVCQNERVKGSMKLLYVIEHISTVGGLERILIDKMNALAAEPEFEVVLMTIWQDDNRPAFPLDERLGQICLGVEKPKSVIGWLTTMPKVLSIYNNKVRAIAPDVAIHFRAMGAMLTAFSSWKGYTVFEAHTARQYSNHRWLYPLMERRADVVVCLTQGDARNYPKARRVEVISNFVRTHAVPASEAERRCLFVGRLCPEKAPLRLVRLWKSIVARHPDWKLDIYGEGELEDTVRKEIINLGIGDSVVMHGYISDMAEVYSRGGILLLCSRTEGLPMVLIEAQNYGLPAVSTDCPYGPADIIKDGDNGFLVPQDNDAAFVDAVSSLIADASLRTKMAERARKTSGRYSREKIMEDWIKLFLER